jgi:peptide chain release factor 2
LNILGAVFEIEKKKNDLQNLTELTVKDDFWTDYKKAQKTMHKIDELRDVVELDNKFTKKIEEMRIALDLLREESDFSIKKELERNINEIEKLISETEKRLLFKDPYDSYPAILNIHPGAGGTESHDWAEMLLRMYIRWMDNNKLNYKITDYLSGEEAGVKNVTLTVYGENAYGLLKSEKGIHRLVRISPFDSSKRRHTSFAAVDVIPLIEDDVEIEIDKDDLKIETFRSTGAGGQHVNVTDSAVRITHIPTGIIVSCQNERSQSMNKETAMKILKSKLHEIEMKKKMDEINGIRGEKKDIGWGSQIRSYILQPYQMVKDHRTDIEIGDVNSVLNGDLNIFINSFLKKSIKKT